MSCNCTTKIYGPLQPFEVICLVLWTFQAHPKDWERGLHIGTASRFSHSSNTKVYKRKLGKNIAPSPILPPIDQDGEFPQNPREICNKGVRSCGIDLSPKYMSSGKASKRSYLGSSPPDAAKVPSPRGHGVLKEKELCQNKLVGTARSATAYRQFLLHHKY